MTIRVTDLADHLVGSWALWRAIEIHTTGERAHLAGRAVWEPDATRPSRLLYREWGELTMAEHRGPASRSYRFELAGEGVDVHFDDGRYFYSFDLTEGRAEIVHVCGNDRYRGTLVAHSPTELEQTWRVEGPSKDYTSTTTFLADRRRP